MTAETLEKFGVSCGRVRLQDKGEIDCTIKARLSAALLRSTDEAEPVSWESLK